MACFYLPKKPLLFINMFSNTLALQDVSTVPLSYLALFSVVNVFDSDTTTNII